MSRPPDIDPRVNYVKLEEERMLNSFYVAGYYNREFKCHGNDKNYGICKESYDLGADSRIFDKKTK